MESSDVKSEGVTSLPMSLHDVLLNLHQHPYPHVPNPPSCKKRASVALVIRVRPTYNDWPNSELSPLSPSTASVEQRLEAFFSQSWVQNGDPEALFIKRASRVGDRWTGHVALPGGKRDPTDADDREAAIREASEEVGLDLMTDDCIYVGNLPERVVTTGWNSTPHSPTLRLQPTEVASTHWVPLRALLSPAQRTVEYVDMTQRYAKTAGLIARLSSRHLLGLMEFSAVSLKPTESLQCNSSPGLVSEGDQPVPSLLQRLKACCWDRQADPRNQNKPLLLWGLTLGILADFLDMLPPHTAVQLWKYPTFTSPDLRLMISVLTYKMRKQNKLQAKSESQPSNTAVDNQTAALAVTDIASTHEQEVNIEGLGVGGHHGVSKSIGSGEHTHAVGIMLKGYYARLKIAIHIFLVWRAAIGSVAAIYAWKFFRHRR